MTELELQEQEKRDNEIFQAAKTLTVGELITYKDLCEKLNIPYYNGGNIKEAQLKNDVSRFIEFEKVNRKLLITEIYDEYLPPDLSGISANAIYVKYIETILLQFLSTQEDYTFHISPQRLWLKLGMINSLYKEYKRNDNRKILLKMDEDMTDKDINDFYMHSESKFSKILISALNSLERRKLLFYNKVYRYGMLEESGYLDYHDATDEEVKEVLNIEKQILNELELHSVSQLIFSPGLRAKYYEMRNSLCRERYGWSNVFQCYKLVYNKENIIKELPEDEIRLEKLKLNYLSTYAIDNQKCNIDKSVFRERYKELQEILSNKLLKLWQTDEETASVIEYFKDHPVKQIEKNEKNKNINIDELFEERIIE